MKNYQEKTLVLRAQRGDRDALGELWDILTPKLFGYLVNVTHSQTLAEDILQKTWLRAIKALSRFQQRNISISAWLFAIARNECRQYWRTAWRETQLDPLKHDVISHNQSGLENKIMVEQA